MKMMRRSTQMMKMSTGSLLLLLALCVIRSQAISTVEVNTGPSQAEPQIAMFCGRQLLHMNVESGQWEPDPQGRQGCFTEPTQIISYCQEMYPALQISHVEESSSPVTIPAWCATGFSHCQTRPFIVIPYRCLGEYVSEALLVPDRCRFLHQEQMDTCETYVYWHGVARQACSAESLELHSYGMLLPCGERFRGVEYVCCPGRAGSSSGRFEGDETLQSVTVTPPPGGVTAGSSVKATPATAKPTTSAESQQEEEGDEEEEEEEVGELEEGGAKDGEYEYSIDSGPYQATDYLDSVYYEKSSRSRTSAVPHTRGDSFPTPRPTDGVDVYFEMPGEDSEHASFLRARMDLEERRMKSINEIMKEWAEADNQSRNLPKSDRQALNEHFQSVLQTLEEQVAGERQRLVETHLARVVASLNNNRRLALESYLSAVQSDPPQAERVLQALKRYMSAEQKDRRHTLRHYHHIETVDPQKAEQMKFQVYTHLHVIEERMNQSLALLYKMPLLAEELHDEIQELVKEERSDLSQLMTTSFSETRTTEELLPAESEEEKDDEEEEERAFQSRPYPPRIDSQTSSRKGSTMDEYDYNAAEKVPTYEYEEKVSPRRCRCNSGVGVSSAVSADEHLNGAKEAHIQIPRDPEGRAATRRLGYLQPRCHGRAAGGCRGHRHGDGHQSAAGSQETIWYYQPRHCGGGPHVVPGGAETHQDAKPRL